MAERCVVVGAGGISGAWFPPLQKEGVEVAAVVDLSLESAQARIKQYELDAMASTDLEATLKQTKPDFVLDLTIPEAHRNVTCTALKAGCHVIGEKPMASSMDEARDMVRTSEETGMLYMVSQSRRWEPKHYTIRRTIAESTMGEITTLNCDFFLGVHFGGFREEMPSPLILDMSIHHFDLARFMTGLDPVAVYAKEYNPKGSWYKGDVAASCIFEMSNDVIFTYRGSWCSEGCNTSWQGDWRIIGNQGTMIYAGDADPYGEYRTGGVSTESDFAPLEILPDAPPATGMHGGLLEMLTFLRTGQRPQTECHDNIKSLAMVFAAMESARTGMRIPVRVM